MVHVLYKHVLLSLLSISSILHVNFRKWRYDEFHGRDPSCHSGGAILCFSVFLYGSE